MADASAVINRLGLQLAQAIVEKTIAEVELAEAQRPLAEVAEKEHAAE